MVCSHQQETKRWVPRRVARRRHGLWVDAFGDSAEVSAEGGDHHGDDFDQCLGERENHGYERLISFINRY